VIRWAALAPSQARPRPSVRAARAAPSSTRMRASCSP
jgi:hypothetical protein